MVFALIFAGGVGRRMNSTATGIPKQFLEIHGKPVIVHTIEHFQKCAMIDGICVVVGSDWLDYMKALSERYGLAKIRWLVPGGETALSSQYNGLKAISKSGEENCIVMIHDGVRPLIDEKLIQTCIDGVRLYGSAVTVAPAIETVVQVDSDKKIAATCPRETCRLARAPQCFYLKDILDAHERARREGVYDFVDSASLLLYYGMKIHTVEGPSENMKITNHVDFLSAGALLDAKGKK